MMICSAAKNYIQRPISASLLLQHCVQHTKFRYTRTTCRRHFVSEMRPQGAVQYKSGKVLLR